MEIYCVGNAHVLSAVSAERKKFVKMKLILAGCVQCRKNLE